MYDPETEIFIRSARSLSGLEGVDLAAELTRVYTWLAARRLRTSSPAESDSLIESQPALFTPPRSAAREMDRLRRLAATYETLALLQPVGTAQRAASAFIAATAHELLARAAEDDLVARWPTVQIGRDFIGSGVSAALLFLMAGYPSDAAEVARRLSPRDGQSPRDQLERAIALLAAGELGRIRETTVAFPFSQLEEHSSNPLLLATDVLFWRLTNLVSQIAGALLGELPDGEIGARQEVDRIVELSVESASTELIETIATVSAAGDTPSPIPIVSSFGGPYHLARLLRGAIDDLFLAAVVQIRPPDGTSTERWTGYRSSLAQRRPYLWPNHREAVRKGYLAVGTSSVITFPTGAGKSTLAELKIASALGAGRGVVYLAPTHALAGQAARDLQLAFPDLRVVQSLAAESEYSEVDLGDQPEVAVMTPERCLTLLGVAPETFQNVGVVILDECHILDGSSANQDRRALDSMLSVLGMFDAAPATDFVLLSAMVENGDELARWIAWATARPCLSLALDWKPTRQARSCILFRNSDIRSARIRLARASRQNQGDFKSPPKSVRETVGASPYALFGLTHSWTRELAPEQYSVQRLLDNEISLAGKSWNYLTSDASLISATLTARLALHGIRTLTFVHQRKSFGPVVRAIVAQLKAANFPLPSVREDDELLYANAVSDLGSTEAVAISLNAYVDVHHGLLLVHERRLAERRFSDPQGTRALVATGTVAQGMNLPAEAVVISGTKRYEMNDDEDEEPDGSWKPVGAEELLNAAGRAGRAGKQSAGLAFLVPNEIVELRDDGQPGQEWEPLFRAVFSKTDRCLRVRDPITALLDRLTTTSETPARNLRYFLNRIPPASSTTTDSGAPSVPILRRALGAFQAHESSNDVEFSRRIGLVPGAQEALTAVLERRPDLAWLDGVAWKLGLPVRTVRGLHARISEAPIPQDSTVVNCLHWVFDWLAHYPNDCREIIKPSTLTVALSPEEAAYFDRENYESIAPAFPTIAARTLEWMRGSPLTEIEELLNPTRVDGRRNRRGAAQCETARRFALRFTVELSYAAGAVALVSREKGLAGVDFEMTSTDLPLALSIVASCIREGVDSPAALAVRYYLGPTTPRRLARELAEIYRDAIGVVAPTIRFPDLRVRVAKILRDAAIARGPQ